MLPQLFSLWFFHFVPYVKEEPTGSLPTFCWRLSADPLSGAFFSLGTKLCWELVKPLSQRSNEWFSAALKGREYPGQPASRNTLCSKELDLPFPEMFRHFRRLRMEGISLRSAHTLSICNCLLLQSPASAASWFNPATPHTWSSSKRSGASASRLHPPWNPLLPSKGCQLGLLGSLSLANPGLVPKSLCDTSELRGSAGWKGDSSSPALSRRSLE